MLLSSEEVYQSQGNSRGVEIGGQSPNSGRIRRLSPDLNVPRIFLKRQSQRSLEFACTRNLVCGNLTEVVAVDA